MDTEISENILFWKCNPETGGHERFKDGGLVQPRTFDLRHSFRVLILSYGDFMACPSPKAHVNSKLNVGLESGEVKLELTTASADWIGSGIAIRSITEVMVIPTPYLLSIH